MQCKNLDYQCSSVLSLEQESRWLKLTYLLGKSVTHPYPQHWKLFLSCLRALISIPWKNQFKATSLGLASMFFLAQIRWVLSLCSGGSSLQTRCCDWGNQILAGDTSSALWWWCVAVFAAAWASALVRIHNMQGSVGTSRIWLRGAELWPAGRSQL